MEYLKYKFRDSKDFVNSYDELPLWSAQFGFLLLKHIELKPGITLLDIGSGTGFPLIELAERLGTSSKCYGLDTWKNANKRAMQKIKSYKIKNAEVIEGSAEKIPFDNESIDLITSNLGINNFENPEKVFAECNRVLKPNGKLVITTNLNGHWKEFFKIFKDTMSELKKDKILKKLKDEEEHRGTIQSVRKLFTDNGFQITGYYKEKFEMKFVDGSAFLRHHFVKLGWLESWKNLIPDKELKTLFKRIEHNLNSFARKRGGLKLTVPMMYIEGVKI